MLLVSRRRRGVDIWPGFVDALSALLMVVIFVLLLFSFAQFLLSQVLDEQETELDVMYQRVVELTDLLGLEQERSAQLTRDVDALGIQVTQLGEQRRLMPGRRRNAVQLAAQYQGRRGDLVGVLDHGQRRAILDGTGRVVALELDENRTRIIRHHALQSHQRRVADRLLNRFHRKKCASPGDRVTVAAT